MIINKSVNPGYRWVILIINFFICALAYAGLNTWNTASIELSKTFQISATAASMGSGLFMLGYAVGSLVENYVSSKKGYRAGGLLGLIFMVIGIFIIPIAPNYGLVLLGRFLQGWGILWLIGVNSSVAWFPASQRGLASSLIGAALVVGLGAGSLLATALINISGTWQGAFKIFGIILLVAAVIWALLMKNPPKDLYSENIETSATITEGKSINPYKTVAAWLCAFCLFFNAFQLIGANTLAPRYLADVGYSSIQAGTIILFMGLIGAISTPLGGIVSDKLAKKIPTVKARAYTQAFLGFAVAAVATIVFPLLAPVSYGAAIIFGILLGFGVPVTNATIGALPMDLLDNQKAANDMFALIILLGIGAGGLISPIAANYFAENFGWTAAFILLGIGAGVATLISFILPKFKLKKANNTL
jgi:MFS family permease